MKDVSRNEWRSQSLKLDQNMKYFFQRDVYSILYILLSLSSYENGTNDLTSSDVFFDQKSTKFDFFGMRV